MLLLLLLLLIKERAASVGMPSLRPDEDESSILETARRNIFFSSFSFSSCESCEETQKFSIFLFDVRNRVTREKLKKIDTKTAANSAARARASNKFIR
jgi:hypothetical protein